MKNSSSPQVTVTTENDEGLQVLFDKLVDESDSLEADGLEFEGKTKPAGVAGSGIPEISNLVLALGSAGVFTALTSVLIAYFRSRPKGRIVLTSKRDGTVLTLSAHDCDPVKLATALQPLFKK